MKNFSHPLMDNNITNSDVNSLISFLRKNKKKIFTQSTKVIEFEKKWSKWLGTKYSIFVNSGSSANLLTIQALGILYGKGEVIVPPLTWISDIAAVIQNGFKPIFADINPNTLCMDEDEVIKKINKKTKAVFITHVQGFNGLSNNLLKILKQKKIVLLEDVCESHGATFNKKKLGSYGLISNFSFYYAHHMSTIEGGMICTNDRKVYELVRVLRSHGMLRECGNLSYEKKMIKNNPKLSPKFIFLYPAYNLRNTEMPAVIGLNQIKRLDKNNRLRTKNFKLFLKYLNNDFYKTNFELEGSSNYAFPLVLKKANFKNRDLLEKVMKNNKIEFRRGNAGGGNQLRQPYLKKHIKGINLKNFKEVDHIHFFGYYIGNYPSLKKDKILKICNILNNINYE
ncbi:aminotransferase class I/II-fold pyridoxal phosphate-dependent enzyme [Candidatus Pelagibacter sp.]|nr:aminotransferase class I/II-fold pyridoxal phosphate-dependent enzyme [Candidatus Pelagibacter sp.]